MKKLITTIAFVCVFLFSGNTYASALLFDGSNDYITAGDVVFGSLTDHLTLEAWAKPIDTGSGFAKPIIRKYGEASNGSCCPVGSFGLSYYGYQNLDRMHLGVEEQGLISPNGAIVNNEWVHVAAVYDGSTATMELYLNGALSNTVSHSGDIDKISTELSFGGTPQKISQYRFYGTIDEIRIWDVALSQAEIQENMYKELIGDEQGLIGYWNFNEGSGDIAYDSSGSGNHGTLVGTPDWVEDSPIVSAPVPEPTTIFLLGTGIVGLIGFRRKRRE